MKRLLDEQLFCMRQYRGQKAWCTWRDLEED
jgi:hypothetical protein